MHWGCLRRRYHVPLRRRWGDHVHWRHLRVAVRALRRVVEILLRRVGRVVWLLAIGRRLERRAMHSLLWDAGERCTCLRLRLRVLILLPWREERCCRLLLVWRWRRLVHVSRQLVLEGLWFGRCMLQHRGRFYVGDGDCLLRPRLVHCCRWRALELWLLWEWVSVHLRHVYGRVLAR